jgi:predicted ATPase
MMKKDNAGKPLRIYIAGAHSTGKTTLARWVARTWGLPIVTEVARAVLAETELSFATLRVDLDKTADFQREVFRRQAVAEDSSGHRFVSDRAFDNLAYAASHTIALKEILASTVGAYAARLALPGSIVFFVRPHKALLADDGTRERLDWEELIRIDGMIRLLFELHDIDYVSLASSGMAERARTVRAVLRAAGAPPL